VTLLGAASLQSYVFASNRLRENAGASYLVWRAMEEWREGWESMGAKKFLFAGGGNAALVFKDADAARAAIARWSGSEGHLKDAAGLRLTAAHEPVTTTLQKAFRKAETALAASEEAPPGGFEFGALPVVRACPSSGRAASVWDEDLKDWVSRDTACKRNAVDAANERLKADFPAPGYEFPEELANLGIREGASQIALVHADGNRIGRKRSEIVAAPYPDDDAFVRALAEFSGQVNRSASAAFGKMLDALLRAIPALEDKKLIKLSKAPGGGTFLPLRPIVYGGDDVTFVCHGRLGITLAKIFLEAFAEADAGFTACAGVLIMPQKFPFARGYALAGELCTSAKRKRHEAKHEAKKGGSWLDFQVLTEGASGSLEVLRESYFASDGKSLICRPYLVPGGWAQCESIWRKFTEGVPRSRAKRVLEMLARGSDETRAFLANLPDHGKLPDPGVAGAQEAGWDANGSTPYFDPLELLDLHADSELFQPAGGAPDADAAN
jgi:hypothetical protein